MGKMKNYMMDIEEFCDGYDYGEGVSDFIIDEIVEDVGMYFKSNEASKYAKTYLTTQLGEF
jgi:hypothetical protein|tara:strand:+ start:1523 stop:1705 length:183 start_codon:yes stop_codon:yes gene_type:complete